MVELALYHPEGGFYAATGGHAGRRGDFLTSPEVGPLFGAVLARALDTWWVEAGRPAVFEVVEVGAGPGTLARSVLAAGARCASALRYVLVERSAVQRDRHGEHLPQLVLGESGEQPPAPHDAPVVMSRSELPDWPGPRVVLANELLDNLPFGLLERTAQGWAAVHVGLDGDALVEVLVPTDLHGWRDEPIGARVPQQAVAAAWVGNAVAAAGPGGRVVAIDYASTTPELAARPWSEWVRTYRRHERGGPVLADLGRQDITCEVAIDQLPSPASNRSQADWLRGHGVDELVAEGRRVWRDRAAIADLAAVRGRSRIPEAEALLDESGLGAFRVLEWPGS